MDRTVNPKNTTRDTPSQIHHQRLGHMCPDIHQGVEIPLRFVRTIHQGVLKILRFLSGLHQGYPQNFCQICPDYHQGSSPIFRGPHALEFSVKSGLPYGPENVAVLTCENQCHSSWLSVDLVSYAHHWEYNTSKNLYIHLNTIRNACPTKSFNNNFLLQ